ncbi:hypothetical protein OUZ56_023658 [Daphnia magna]|uniref:Uncharacterized protein n=1 Tax=Daphnia magna TaxID=35525 RepID=A0ABR0AZB2_9CRUS|nr:hypothetical protein OUZ56_023658 [Daphnia magna]
MEFLPRLVLRSAESESEALTDYTIEPVANMGFEPTRAMHNGLAVHHLNHSVTSSDYFHHVEVLSPNALADDFNNTQI